MSYIKTKDGIFEVATISDEPIIDFDGKPDYDDTRAVYTTTNENHKYYYATEVLDLLMKVTILFSLLTKKS